ncbi:MAG: RNA polymerase sigma factor [Chloroflexota bacterium]|nr:RNA polymerase sigma factor [Chloroflexota bacterium]
MAKQLGREEIEALYCQYSDMAFRISLAILGDSEKANDVVQEVFIKVHQLGGNFNQDRGGFKAWIRRITVNQSISVRRRKDSHCLSFEMVEAEGSKIGIPASKLPDEVLLAKEKEYRVQQAICALDEKHLSVIVLRYFEELSYEEIAEILQIPLGTVKSRHNKAMKLLNKELREDGFEL